MQAIILAAGKGKRFPGDKPKVLQQVAGRSLLQHVILLVNTLGIARKVVVIGHLGEQVQQGLSQEKDLFFAWQKEQLGTGHAVKMALPHLKKSHGVLILYGDVPALRKETVRQLITEHQHKRNTLTILTASLQDPKWYGRILKDTNGKVLGIREAKDCTVEELQIKEINSGIMVVETVFLYSALEKLRPNNQQGEYYLTDIVELACQEGKAVSTVITPDEDEIKGVNSPEELIEMEKIFKERSN
ncbi:NTP transferase domain-containing protein [Candidatus Woesearchaeota archaeon]|nr:NTP transferase domain-containing protein [Candidatus Woesearchaeota archaeon]